jgi:hypothetical protein
MTLYFNAKELPESTPEYVAWVDVMGTQSVMSRSLSIAANFIFKLHTAALDAQKKTDGNIHLYPVMDGLYASSSSQEAILYFLRSVFCKIAETLILEENNMYRFIVRGALAFGPIIHGKNVSEKTSNVLGCEPGIQYKKMHHHLGYSCMNQRGPLRLRAQILCMMFGGSGALEVMLIHDRHGVRAKKLSRNISSGVKITRNQFSTHLSV